MITRRIGISSITISGSTSIIMKIIIAIKLTIMIMIIITNHNNDSNNNSIRKIEGSEIMVRIIMKIKATTTI